VVAFVGIGGCGAGLGTRTIVSSEFDESLYSTELLLPCSLQAIPASSPGQQLIRFALTNNSSQTSAILKRETPLFEPSSDRFLI
jgi:hypothetical protein